MEHLFELRPFDAPVVVLDFETTGLYPGLGHRIVEIGALRLEPDPSSRWREAGRLSRFIQPGRPIDPSASRVNGIYDADLVGAPAFAEVAGELLALLHGAILVAHNARFDAGFLGMELYLLSRSASPGQYPSVLPNPWLCTLQLARKCFYFGGNSLGQVARRLGVRAGRAHRALGDVYTTAEVLKRMTLELSRRRLETVGDLLHAQGGAIYTPPPPQITLPAPLAEALLGDRPVQIRYRGPAGESERLIRPLYPAVHEGMTYLIAYCHLRQAQRTFRLDHIVRAEIVAGP